MKKAVEIKLWILINLHNETCKNYFIDLWRKVVTRYKESPMLWGYDMYNEPAKGSAGTYPYFDPQYKAGKAIREIDPNTPIIVESDNFDSASTYNA